MSEISNRADEDKANTLRSEGLYQGEQREHGEQQRLLTKQEVIALAELIDRWYEGRDNYWLDELRAQLDKACPRG